MANQNATVAAAGASTPQTLVAGHQQGGELRVLFSTLTNPSAGGVAVGEVITWGFLPVGARVIFGYLSWSTGTASSTLNIGDRATPARYLAATAITTAGAATLLPPATAAAGAAGHVVAVSAPGQATDQTEIRSVCAGAIVAVNQTLTLMLAYVTND
jgi:hypothetical protein